VMQVAVYQVVRMVAVGDRLVAAAGAVRVTVVVTVAAMIRGALGRVAGIDLEAMVIHVAIMHVVHVPVMQVIGVPIVHYCSVAAVRAVLMGMSFVRVVLHVLSSPK
jgi:hypothetical protein